MLRIIVTLVTYYLSVFLLSVPAFAAVFNVASGDFTALIAAINAANSNGEENTVNLDAGTYTLTAVNNNTVGPTGLPSVISRLTIKGVGVNETIIERDPAATGFRIMHVAATGVLTLNGITLRGGGGVGTGPGGGVRSDGVLTLTNCIVADNSNSGISSDGTLTLSNSVVVGNSASRGGGLEIGGGSALITQSNLINNTASDAGGGIQPHAGGTTTLTIQDSTFTGNSAARGGAIDLAAGTITLRNSTVTNNTASDSGGAVNYRGGVLTLLNSTVANNTAANQGGGLNSFFGDTRLKLQNTILALNVGPTGPDCSGFVTSLGNNLIGDPTGCTITLQPSDRTGDAGLGTIVNPGTPGSGRIPLLPGSPAINAGNNAACPPTDQLGTPRNGRCDIGAVEFYPVANDLVALGNLTTSFDPTPLPGGPAGIFRITAEFTNTSNQAIVNPFAEVVELTGGNLLLNADGGAGGVGARVTTPDSATTPFEPGASGTLEFLIGLQQREPFTFFVNMLGEPQTSNPFVSRR